MNSCMGSCSAFESMEILLLQFPEFSHDDNRIRAQSDDTKGEAHDKDGEGTRCNFGLEEKGQHKKMGRIKRHAIRMHPLFVPLFESIQGRISSELCDIFCPDLFMILLPPPRRATICIPLFVESTGSQTTSSLALPRRSTFSMYRTACLKT